MWLFVRASAHSVRLYVRTEVWAFVYLSEGSLRLDACVADCVAKYGVYLKIYACAEGRGCLSV